jgi:hypothetical protein
MRGKWWCQTDSRRLRRSTPVHPLFPWQAGAVKGVGSALDRVENCFMDAAEELFPVIEVDAGRGIEFVLNRGATLRLGQGRT